MKVVTLVAEAPVTAPLAPVELPDAVLTAARDAAEAVDAEGRFPSEALAQLRRHGLLGAFVPEDLGGAGLPFAAVAGQCQALAAACSSAGMVLAMHHIQVACLARHAASQPWMRAFLRRVQDEQLLLASSTSEAEVGGALRTSKCAVERDGEGGFTLKKVATAISYGAHADALLVTARLAPDAPSGDQVFVVLERDALSMERTGEWDALGMRGTGSEPFVIEGSGVVEQVVDTPFSEIAAATMVPVSHMVWGAVWTGIAGDAVERARQALKSRRKGDALPQGAQRLAQAVELLQMAEARIRAAIAAFDWNAPVAPSFAGAAWDNGLKISVSEACFEVVREALCVCGFAGYARAGRYSVSRHLRDLLSAPLMIGNDRMRESSARLLLAQKPKLGL